MLLENPWRRIKEKNLDMKSLLKELFFDKYLVKRIKTEQVNPGVLYQELVRGRITLQEYLAANK